MQLNSYAQNFEDVMLWRALGHVRAGCYIDIGAQDPDVDSVSRRFYEQGWRGVHVEPTPQYASALRKRRPEETVIEAAISDRNGVINLFEIPDTGLSTTRPEVADSHRTGGMHVNNSMVPCITLDALLEQLGAEEIHWLKIDVEGAEETVLRGWTLSAPKPWVVVIESTLPLTDIQSHGSWEKLVLDMGYEFVYFDGLNRFYVSHAHPELKDSFKCGPNVFDRFSLTSTSPFCDSINEAYFQLSAKTADLESAVGDAKIEAHRWWTAHERAVQEAVIAAEMLEEQRNRNTLQEAETVRWFAAHEALLAKLNDAFEMIETQRLESHRWWLAHERLSSQLDDARVESQTARAESQTARAESQAVRAELQTQFIEANKWWLAHEARVAELDVKGQEIRHLNLRLAEFAGSTSWRITAPLRFVSRSGSKLVRFGARGVIRSTLLSSIRFVFERPFVHRHAKSIATRFPGLYGRLRALAVTESVYVLPASSQLNVPILTDLSTTGMAKVFNNIYLDPRAKRVRDLLEKPEGGSMQ